ncbi:MAG: zinc ribbon domain-containing protein [Pseudomonadota bacterium]
MPIYEYHCDGCGHEFEEMQKVNDAPVTRCETCGGDKVVRLISRSSFQLKGGGWYADLYGSSSSKGKNSPSSSTASTPASSSSTTSTSSTSPSSSTASTSSASSTPAASSKS